MNEQLKEQLRGWAKKYNTVAFIQDDPVQFPHRYKEKRDIEVSAFLTAWISYGRRELILRKAGELHSRMDPSPYRWIMSEGYNRLPETVAEAGQRDTFYRFYTYTDLRQLCARLKEIYETYDSLEDALDVGHPTPIANIQHLFAGIQGIPVLTGTSACKRLAMFLRWMVRKDGIVDLGIWETWIQSHQLIIPLDTHVHQLSLQLRLTTQKAGTLRTALEITEALKKVFPDDPCLGDFALFGYDINRER